MGRRGMNRLLRILTSIDQPTQETDRYSATAEAGSDFGKNGQVPFTDSNQVSRYASHNP